MKSNIAKHLSRAMRVSASVASLLVFSSISARGESAAGLVRADVESGGFALVGLPFHPFSNGGGVGGVLDGTFLGGAGPHASDAASVWRSGPQAWTNAWFGPDGVWLGLEDYPFRAGERSGREIGVVFVHLTFEDFHHNIKRSTPRKPDKKTSPFLFFTVEQIRAA